MKKNSRILIVSCCLLVLCVAVLLLVFLKIRSTGHNRNDFSKCEFRQMETPQSDPMDRVSIAELDARHLLFANQRDLLLFDKENGEQKILVPDFSQLPRRKGVSVPPYMPTGVSIDREGEIYVANGRGNNVLRGKIRGEKITFTHCYSSPNSIGPKNVSADKQRDILVSANYYGGTVTAFQISTGKQLWCTPVGQAHGVVIDQDFVYVTSLVTRDIQKLDLKTGEVILRRGGIGWDPMSDHYLWPTSVQNLDQDHLVVADAQTGYISKVRKEDLKVIKYFGGNGPSVDQFNYPYVAIRLSDGLYISSARRAGLLRLQLDPLRVETFWYDPEFYSPAHYMEPPLGEKWDGYWDVDTGHEIHFYDYTFRMGWGLIRDKQNKQDFVVADPIDARYEFSADKAYLLQGKQIFENCSMMLSSGSHRLWVVFDASPDLPAMFLCFHVDFDTWLLDNGDMVCAGHRLTSDDFRKIVMAQVDILRKKMRTQGRLTKDDLLNDAWGISVFRGKTGSGSKVPVSKETIDRCFTSLDGRIFLWQYDRDPDDLPAIRKASEEYYRNVRGTLNLRLDEYLLVGMLSGISPEAVSPKDARFTEVDSNQGLNSLSALTTPSLSDYTSADTIPNAKFYFIPPDPEAKLDRIELIWYSQDEAGKEIRISGVEPNGEAVPLFEGNCGGMIRNGYAVSEIPLKTTQVYPKYLFELLKGGKQERLLLRAFTPEWERKIADPLLRYARDVSLKKIYGEGIRTFSPNEEIEKAENWQCGNFAVWFARHFPFKYKTIRILGLSSVVTGAIHAVVEVVFEDGTTKVIDPTLGIVYDSGIQHLLDGSFDFETGTHFSRTVSPIFNLYYGPQFFYQTEIKSISNENAWKEKTPSPENPSSATWHSIQPEYFGISIGEPGPYRAAFSPFLRTGDRRGHAASILPGGSSRLGAAMGNNDHHGKLQRIEFSNN